MTLTEDAVRGIEAYSWPGNVRELENAVKRAVIMADGQQITREDIGLEHLEGGNYFIDLRQVREDAERRAVTLAISRADGNIARTAGILGISRPTLYDLMHRLGLK